MGAGRAREKRMQETVPQSQSMDIQRILSILPHRYPFLLVDRVVECVPGSHIKAYKNVSVNEPFFQGHFPGVPIMPGVLILEALADQRLAGRGGRAISRTTFSPAWTA